MAQVTLESNGQQIKVAVTLPGKVDDFNLAMALVRAIRGFDGAFPNSSNGPLEENVKKLFVEMPRNVNVNESKP